MTVVHLPSLQGHSCGVHKDMSLPRLQFCISTGLLENGKCIGFLEFSICSSSGESIFFRRSSQNTDVMARNLVIMGRLCLKDKLKISRELLYIMRLLVAVTQPNG